MTDIEQYIVDDDTGIPYEEFKSWVEYDRKFREFAAQGAADVS